MGFIPSTNPFMEYCIPTFLVNNIDITNESIIIELGEGEYTLDFGILLHQHNVVIKGCGKDKTTLKIPKNIDYSYDDAIIDLQGDYHISQGVETDKRISVTIIGLTIETNVTKSQAQAQDYDLTCSESYLIKCYNVKSFVMRDVRIKAENVETTCLNIRRGFNIDIRECEFISRNRRWTGGNIWLQGDIENVFIEHNDFYKYGNDEVIGITDVNNFVGVNDSDEISKKNINIRYNRFYCQDANGGENNNAIISESGIRGTWDGCNQRFITCFTDQDNNKEKINGEKVQRDSPCHQIVNGIHLDNNEFHINAPLSHLFTVSFDKYTTYKDVTMNGNIIDYGTWIVDGGSSNWKELMDFCIYYDHVYVSTVLDGNYDGFCDEPIYICGNTLTCGTNIRNLGTSGGVSYYQDNHLCVDIKGTKVVFYNNDIKCVRESYSQDEYSYARKGIEILHCGEKGGEAVLRNNHCEGIRCLSSLTGKNANQQITKARLYCSGNYLQGNPRINHNHIVESHEFMVNNEIIADYPVFFLQEFANNGTAVFTGNRVYRDMTRVTHYSSAYGHIYYTGNTGSGNNIQSMKFICCDNIFENTDNTQSMYEYIQSNIIIVHKNNIFDDTLEQ